MKRLPFDLLKQHLTTIQKLNNNPLPWAQNAQRHPTATPSSWTPSLPGCTLTFCFHRRAMNTMTCNVHYNMYLKQQEKGNKPFLPTQMFMLEVKSVECHRYIFPRFVILQKFHLKVWLFCTLHDYTHCKIFIDWQLPSYYNLQNTLHID